MGRGRYTIGTCGTPVGPLGSWALASSLARIHRVFWVPSVLPSISRNVLYFVVFVLYSMHPTCAGVVGLSCLLLYAWRVALLRHQR